MTQWNPVLPGRIPVTHMIIWVTKISDDLNVAHTEIIKARNIALENNVVVVFPPQQRLTNKEEVHVEIS